MNLSGNVVNVDGTFLSGAKVWVNNVVYSTSTQMLWTFTDQFGNWSISVPNNARYQVTATSPGVVFRFTNPKLVAVTTFDIGNLNFQAYAFNSSTT